MRRSIVKEGTVADGDGHVSYFDLKKAMRVERPNVALTRENGPRPLG